MGLFGKSSKKELENLTEAPLGYWEEKSYFLVIPRDESVNLYDGIFERVSSIEGVKIKAKKMPEEQPGIIILTYKDVDYEVGFYMDNFRLHDMMALQHYFFTKEEMEALTKASRSLTFFMEYPKDSKTAFHLQLKLACAMVPDMLAIMDESAEKMICKKWAQMAAGSHVTPGSKDLYMVQAISGKGEEVWLHTHGLCRCGLTELEILQSNKKNYESHYQVISTFASYLLDKKEEFVPKKSSAYIGSLASHQPVVVTYLPWIEGLKEYKKVNLGNVADRREGHNSKTGLVFAYTCEEDEINGKLTKIPDFDGTWGENPLFFISSEETERMKALAMERFDFVKEAAKKADNHIIIKIGLPIDKDNDEYYEEDNYEHIWFELLSFDGERFRAKLMQEPYGIASVHAGDEAEFTVEDVTDWVIYTPEFSVIPDTAYLLA